MSEHQYGPKGAIVDVFIKHVRGMTKARRLEVVSANRATYAEETAAARAALHAARDARWDHTVWDAAQDCGWDHELTRFGIREIQGADLLRARGQPFFFLPMFGFADERAVINQPEGFRRTSVGVMSRHPVFLGFRDKRDLT